MSAITAVLSKEYLAETLGNFSILQTRRRNPALDA
jgi:hypothetical protein